MKKKRFLIVRFSSMGDVVLTTPVIRSLKKGFPDAEVHYLTKPFYAPLLTSNPHIHKVHILGESIREQAQALKKYKFERIFDLHNNLRTRHLKLLLGGRWTHFDKKNLAKYRLVNWKNTDIVIPHIVQRYTKTLNTVGIDLDNEGLDFFIPNSTKKEAKKLFSELFSDQDSTNVLAIALGATYFTKRWLPDHFIEVINELKRPVLLLGGPDMLEESKYISEKVNSTCVNIVGKYDMVLSAALMKNCREVLTHDTGFMHIAAAFKMPLYVLWGNTVPEMGMAPFRSPHYSLEVHGLHCRPCSKIGYKECPKGHFKCMTNLKPQEVIRAIKDKKAD